MNFMSHFVVTLLKICFVWVTPPMAPDLKALNVQNFYCQPQKHMRDV